MKEREALKLVFEAFGDQSSLTKWLQARDAVKEALAQPEQDEKFCDANCVWTDHHPDCKLAQPEQKPVAWATREDFYRELDRSVNRMRQQMEIKGVVMRCADYDIALPVIDIREGHVLVGQVTTPPQRTWVGLTDIDYAGLPLEQVGLVRWAEAKLKEKNT